MSDFDRNKFQRRKNFPPPTQREAGSYFPYHSTRPYSKNTLYRYERYDRFDRLDRVDRFDRNYERFERYDRFDNYDRYDKYNAYYDKDAERTENKEKPIQHPTILQKARTERSISPKKQKDNEQYPSTSMNEPPATTPVMTSSMKLVEDGCVSYETILEYLHDSPDFLVVGVIGNQGVGKSTILNLIAQNIITDEIKEELFNFASPNTAEELCSDSATKLTESVSSLSLGESVDSGDSGKYVFKEKNRTVPFKPYSSNELQSGSYCTKGIDIYITNNRVILLDCQPVVCTSILDEIINNDTKRSSMTSEFIPTENRTEIQSLQLATFILSICHVTVLVHDWFFDANFVRLLQIAEMLKPSIPISEDDATEYFPNVIIVHNRAELEDFTPVKFKIIQDTYRNVFNKSRFRFESGMGLGTGKFIQSLSPVTCGNSFNVFLLPEYDDDDDRPPGYPPFFELARELRIQIQSVKRTSMLQSNLTEKNWLQLAAKVWDAIRKGSFFIEYSKKPGTETQKKSSNICR